MRFSCKSCQATFQTATGAPAVAAFRCPSCDGEMAVVAEVVELWQDRIPTRRYDLDDLRARLDLEREEVARNRTTPRSPDQVWFAAVQGRQVGPLSAAGIAGLRTRGQLSAASLVWREGWPSWVAAEAVPELRAILGLPEEKLGRPFPVQPKEPAPPPFDSTYAKARAPHSDETFTEGLVLSEKTDPAAPMPAGLEASFAAAEPARAQSIEPALDAPASVEILSSETIAIEETAAPFSEMVSPQSISPASRPAESPPSEIPAAAMNDRSATSEPALASPEPARASGEASVAAPFASPPAAASAAATPGIGAPFDLASAPAQTWSSPAAAAADRDASFEIPASSFPAAARPAPTAPAQDRSAPFELAPAPSAAAFAREIESSPDAPPAFTAADASALGEASPPSESPLSIEARAPAAQASQDAQPASKSEPRASIPPPPALPHSDMAALDHVGSAVLAQARAPADSSPQNPPAAAAPALASAASQALIDSPPAPVASERHSSMSVETPASPSEPSLPMIDLSLQPAVTDELPQKRSRRPSQQQWFSGIEEPKEKSIGPRIVVLGAFLAIALFALALLMRGR